MAIMAKPAGVPANIWTRFEKTVLTPYINQNAARLRRGLSEQDIHYLTATLSNMLERSGISGLGEDAVLPDIYASSITSTPTPEKKGIDWSGMIDNLVKAVPKVAESVIGYKLGKESLKVQAAKPAVTVPSFLKTEGEGFPWMTIGIVIALAAGGFFLARRFKYI
jgi:hypothetical protein